LKQQQPNTIKRLTTVKQLNLIDCKSSGPETEHNQQNKKGQLEGVAFQKHTENLLTSKTNEQIH